MNANLSQVNSLVKRINALLTNEYNERVQNCFSKNPDLAKYMDRMGQQSFRDVNSEPVFLDEGRLGFTELFDFLQEYRCYYPDLGNTDIVYPKNLQL